MNQSIQYNLRNPAFLDDIGFSMIEKQYPCCEGELSGVSKFGKSGITINNGQPNQDEFNSSKTKKKSLLKKFVITGAIIGLGIFALKKGKNAISGAKNLIANFITKIKK